MGFSVVDYARKKKKEETADSAVSTPTKSGGFSVRDYALAKQVPDRLTDYQSFRNKVTAYSDAISRDSQQRNGQYQDKTAFGSYYDKRNVEAGNLLRDAYNYRDYLKAAAAGGSVGQDALDDIESTINYLNTARNGLSKENEYWNQFRDETAYKAYLRGPDYANVKSADDFSEKSQYVSTANGQGKINLLATLLAGDTGGIVYKGTGYDDLLYEWINGNEDAGAILKNNEARTSGAASGAIGSAFTRATGGEQQARQMDEDEVGIFNYLYATEGKDSAYQYYDYLQNELNYRNRQADMERWSNYAQEHPVSSSAFSVAMAPAKGLSYLSQAADYATSGEIDQNSPENKFSYIPSAIRESVNETVENKWGGVGSFAYNTGMSMADFLFTTAVSGGNQNLALAIMGTGAAADATISAKDRGLSDGQAFTLGTIAGAAEVVTEKVSLEALLDKTQLSKSALGYFLKNTLSEGSEEVGSDIINLLADVLVAKDKSEWQTSIDAYKEQGMSDKDALWHAVADQAANMGLDFLGGAVSGGVIGGTVAGINAAATARTGAKFNAMGGEVVGSILNEGLESDPNTESYRRAQQLFSKTENGKRIGNYELGRLYRENVQAIDAENAGGDVLSRAVEEYGTRGKLSNDTAEAILENPTVLNTLTQNAGLNVTEQMTKSARRKAVKSAIESMANVTRTEQTTQRAAADTQKAAVQTEQPQTADTQAYHITRMQQAASTLGENGAKALNASYDGKVRSDEYYAGFASYYDAGISGRKMESVDSDYAGRLTDAQKYAAYVSGQNDAALSLKREQQAAQYAKTAGTESGLVYDDFVRQAVESGRTMTDVNGETRTYLTAEMAETINKSAKALGVRVQFVDSVRGGTANAQIDGSTVLIERNNPNPLMAIYGHEITHRMQELAPKEYRAFREIVAEKEQGSVQKRIDAYAAQGVELTREQALDEVAADYAGRMIDDGKVLDDFIAAHKDDRTLLQKVRDAIRAILDKLTGAEKKKAESAEAKLTAALEAAVERAKQLEGKKNTAQTDGEARYSINEQFGNELQEWVEDGRPAGEHFILGSTGPVLQGLGAIESDIYMNGDKINLILKQHPEMTIREIQRIPEVLEDPVLILKSRNIGRGAKQNTRMVLFGSVKAQNGRPVLCVLDIHPVEGGFALEDMQKVTSAYTKDNQPVKFVKSSDVLYADKKRTTRLLSDIGFQMPISCNRSGYIGSIAYVRDNVKITGVPFSSVVDLSNSERYSLKEDSQGRKLTEEQQEYFRGSKVVDSEGRLKVVYHGSGAVFTEFSADFMSQHGSAEGQGFYFTDNKDMAEGYAKKDGQLLEGYLNISHPLSDSKVTLKRSELKKLIRAIDPTGDDLVLNYDPQGGMGYPSKAWYNRSLEATVDAIFSYNDTDSEMLAEIANAGAGAGTVLETAERVLGYDGYIVEGKYDNATVYVAFGSNQFKNTNNQNPTSDPDIRYSLKNVSPVKPTSDDWKPGATFDEVKAAHPTLFALDADEADTRNPTQITGTVKSYRKIYDSLQAENFHGTILDASSGLGYGTRAGREEYGFDVDDIEPFPDAKYQPNYTDYSALDKTYDVIISNAVLNVMPQDLRDAMVVKIGEMLNPGGRAFINVRGTDVKNAGSKVAINDDLMEYFISNTGSYQKGFTSKELVSYLKDALGDGFTVEPTRKFGAVSAIVTRDDAHFSLKAGTESKSYAALQEENQLLREQMKDYMQLQRRSSTLEESRDYWRGQTQRTRRVTTDKKAVAAAAKSFIKEYSSDLEVADIQEDLQRLYDYIASGYDGKDELTYPEARRRAEKIAEKLVTNAVEADTELYNQYSDLRHYLRSTKIVFGKEYQSQIADYSDFRKAQFGRLKLGSQGATNVDQVYQELSENWPEFFSEARQNNPTDQLIRIADVADELYNITEYNPHSQYMDQAITGAANEIMEQFFDLPQTKKTFADRQAMKLEEAKAKGKQQVQKVREQYTTRLAELREQNRERVQNAIAREQEARDQKINKLKEHYAARDAAGKERQAARALRAKITRHTKTLSQKLLRPTDQHHIPESLRGPVAAMLESINQESQYRIDENGKRVKNGEGSPTKRTAAFLELKERYAKIVQEGGDMTIDPSLLGDDAAGVQGYFDAVIAMKDIKLADMNTEQLQTVWKVVKSVEHSVNTAGKLLSKSKYAQTQELAQALSVGTSSRKAKKSLTKFHALIDLETPYTYFSHYGEAGKAIYRMLRDAQDQQQLMVNHVADAVQKIVDPKTVKALEKSTKTFTTANGEKLTLSTAQIMELYELTKRKQAYNHLLKGGVVQPEVKSAKIRRGTDSVLLTEADLPQITGTLTEEQRKIADNLQALTTGLLADYGNRASMDAYGYRKFTEKDYWPIKSAKEGLHSNIEKGGNNTRAIKNTGMAQAVTPNASNPLDLPGIFTTFANHASEMTDYASWLCTMEDMNHLFNYKFRDQEGNLTGKSIKGLLDRVGGEGSQKYWHNLMEDIQNGINESSDSPMWDIAGKTIGGFKGAAVGANIRVVIQQPTAFFRAAAVLNPQDMARGLARGVTRGNGWKKALQYSPIAMRKDTGGFDISSLHQMSETLFDNRTAVRKMNDTLSAPAGAADAVTWGKLWNACEWATAREHQGLEKGSEAFYQQTAKLFAEVIDQTQVVDGVLQRSNIMRSSNAVVKQATSFMGEPIMSLNLMLRAYDHVRYEQNSAKRGKAIKAMGRAATALVVTNVVNALAQSLIDALRDDDEDKKYWDRFRAAFTGISGDEGTPWEKAWNAITEGNVGDNMNPLGQIPFVKDVFSLIQGYDVSRTEMEIVNDLVQAGQTAVQSIGGNGAKTRAYAVKGLIAAAAKLFGIPASNLARDMWAITRSAAVETDNVPLQYEMEKAIYNITNTGNKNRYYSILYRALEQDDMDTYQHIRKDLIDNMGVDGTSIDSAMRSRYNTAREKNPDYTLPQHARDLIGSRDQRAANKETEQTYNAGNLSGSAYQAYADQRADDYRSMADSLEGSPLFREMDDATKDKVLKAVYDLADEKALEDNSGGKYTADTKWITQADDAETIGIDPWEYALFHVVYGTLEGDKDEDGKTIKGEAKSDHVREWLEDSGLTDAQQAYLWSTKYKSDY